MAPIQPQFVRGGGGVVRLVYLGYGSKFDQCLLGGKNYLDTKRSYCKVGSLYK